MISASRTYLLFVLTSLVVVAPVNAQSLWGGTEYGMSLEQVRTAIPNATPPSQADHLADGSQELLRLENVEIVRTTFSAKFFFKTGKLSQVTLTWKKGQTFWSAMLVYKELMEALRAKYGAEITRDVQRGVLNMATATWLSGRTNINLFAASVGEDDAVLNVNYQVRVARDADKL